MHFPQIRKVLITFFVFKNTKWFQPILQFFQSEGCCWHNFENSQKEWRWSHIGLLDWTRRNWNRKYHYENVFQVKFYTNFLFFSLFPSASPSVSICLSICLCACLYVCLCVCLRVCLFVCVSVCLCMSPCLSVCLCMSVCLSVCLCACVSVCLIVYLLVCTCLSVFLSFSFSPGLSAVEECFARWRYSATSDSGPFGSTVVCLTRTTSTT